MLKYHWTLSGYNIDLCFWLSCIFTLTLVHLLNLESTVHINTKGCWRKGFPVAWGGKNDPQHPPSLERAWMTVDWQSGHSATITVLQNGALPSEFALSTISIETRTGVKGICKTGEFTVGFNVWDPGCSPGAGGWDWTQQDLLKPKWVGKKHLISPHIIRLQW